MQSVGLETGQEFHWNRILPKACDWLESMALGDGDRS